VKKDYWKKHKKKVKERRLSRKKNFLARKKAPKGLYERTEF